MSEAELCERFIDLLPEEWSVYAETQGYDMVLVHTSGVQIAVEAKMSLNPKVLTQIIETGLGYYSDYGPDFKAVLVGKSQLHMQTICRALGVTVLTVREKDTWPKKEVVYEIEPELPELKSFEEFNTQRMYFWDRNKWFDLFPHQRMTLPEYVPDVRPGVPSPQVLGHWKIQAIKICIWIERNKTITRSHFKSFQVDPSRWMNGYWLQKGERRGDWIAGQSFPADAFREQHPTVYPQIEADYEKWSEDI